MKGVVNVQVSTPKVTYHLALERNITVICDEGATGKSLLASLVYDFHNVKNANKTIKCTVSHGLGLYSLTQDLWDSGAYRNFSTPCVFIIDENAGFLCSRECQRWINSGLHYFIIMNRGRELRGLTFSVNSLKRLSGTKVKTLESWMPSCAAGTLDRKGNLWGTAPLYVPIQPNRVITEDSNTGYQFFTHLIGTACAPCGSKVDNRLQGGKAELLNCISRFKKSGVSDVLFIADGAAFGAELEYLWVQSLIIPRFYFYLYESFEWLLLHTPNIYANPRVRELVDNPQVESTQFLSWERYFTKLLETSSRGIKGFEYTKSSLPSGYLTSTNVKALLSYMPEISFEKWLSSRDMLIFEGYTYEYKPLNDCLALFNKNASKMRCAMGYYGADKTREIVFYAPSVRKIYFTKPELQGKTGFKGVRLTKEQVRQHFRI